MNKSIISKLSKELGCSFVFDVDTNSFHSPLEGDMSKFSKWIEVNDEDVKYNIIGICTHYDIPCDEVVVRSIFSEMKKYG